MGEMRMIIAVSAASSSSSGGRFVENPSKKLYGAHKRLHNRAMHLQPLSLDGCCLRWGNCSCAATGSEDDGVSCSGDSASIRAGFPDEQQEGARAFVDARRLVTMAGNAEEALEMIASQNPGAGRIISKEECCQIIVAAFTQGNVELAYSILEAMRSRRKALQCVLQSDQGSTDSWQWPQPDVSTYATVIKGLAASLRVSDAVETVSTVRRRGVPASDEVPFGKVVKCPTCKVALVVVQPQCGIQLVACSKCRYEYELISGNVVSCESESISTNVSGLVRGLRFLQLMKRPIPSAVHSFNVEAPDGVARTHRFATASSEIPGQVGERVTVASAAPARQGFSFTSFPARTPGWQPSEPMAITNHVTGRETPLLRAPPKTGSSAAALNTSFILPAALVLAASSNAATALIDPTLPRAVAVGAAAAIVLGGTANAFLLPRLNQIPSRTAESIAMRQELLSQYELLQSRLQQLTDSAVQEVIRLARMCQLENKMDSVGQDMYGARIERVRKAREGIDERLTAQLELIDSYAKVASMIEIEVEMDMDVVAAETVGTVAKIEEQIQGLLEVEELQKKWKIQAEAADEVERLLSSTPIS